MATTMSLAAAAPSYSYMQHTSTWHSPVPYLFGGLAAMLGLIAFALFILACSYWKLAGQFENQRVQDLEAGKVDGDVKVAQPVMEEKFLVIMAGHDRPTCLATPVTSRGSSFGSNNTSSSTSSSGSGTLVMNKETEIGNMETHEDAQDHD